jgi:hypothetical protein
VVLQRQVRRGAWTRIARLSIDGRASFQRTIAHRAGASYRITYPGTDGRRRAGLAIKPVPRAR